MNRRDALLQILAGMREDMQDYSRLRELLDAQFLAAIQHDSVEIASVGERIVELTARMESRRQRRVELATIIVGEPGARVSIERVAEQLRGAARTTFEASWNQLEAQLQQCKSLNQRNCRLLMDQHDIMQRVLHSENDTYAPSTAA